MKRRCITKRCSNKNSSSEIISLASNMLFKLRTYSQVKYVGAHSVYLAQTLSRFLIPVTDPVILNLDIAIAQVLRMQPTHLEALQAEIQVDFVPASGLYWVVDGPTWQSCYTWPISTMRWDTEWTSRCTSRPIHNPLCARCTIYLHWEERQDDFTDKLSYYDEWQAHVKKEPIVQEREVSASHPINIIIIVWILKAKLSLSQLTTTQVPSPLILSRLVH